MTFPSSQFTQQTATAAAQTLGEILAGRVHVKRVHGVDVVTPGTLGEALGLPRIVARLESRATSRREEGLSDFRALWDTLSSRTQDEVLRSLGWYDPKNLDWEDPRSNRRPTLPGEDED